jgi:transposase
MARHELTEPQWRSIRDLLPGKAGDPGKTAKDNRLFVNAVLWRGKTGAPWRDLPERFGKWNSVFQRFNRWSRRGVWLQIFQALRGALPAEHLLLDSTVIRAHQHAAGAKGGRGPRPSDARGAVGARKSTLRSPSTGDSSRSRSPAASGMT